VKYLKVWTSFREVIQTLKDDEKGRLFDMMLSYAETGEEPERFEGNEAFLFPVAKQMIDLAAERNETLRQNGKKGGRPKSKENQSEADESKVNQEKPNETNGNQTKAEKKRKEKERNEKKSPTVFIPPTVEEVAAYCRERRNSVNADRFVAFYQSKGWRVGNQPMKDWKAAVITWEKRESSPVKRVTAHEFEQRDYSGVQADMMSQLEEEMTAFKKGAS